MKTVKFICIQNGPKTEKDIGKTPKNSCVMELSDDMLTVIEEPRILLPILGKAKDTGFEGHEFFEASSVRKINGKYYLIYSSVRSRELCYAISEKPDREYRYAGVLSDNSGVIEEQDKNRIQIMWGNNHGSIEQINGKWYVFYHRPTNKTQFSRQACVEELVMLPDGRFQQAEMTSQGFNGAPLEKGTYPASIACILHGKLEPEISRPDSNAQPYVTQDAPDKNPDEIQDENAAPKQYITCIEDGGCAGYKYFQFDDLKKITITTRGCAKGEICVRIQENDKEIGRILVTPSEDWEKNQTDIKEWRGIGTLMLEYYGRGMLDMLEISLE
jgi:xylosidase/arabinosidase